MICSVQWQSLKEGVERLRSIRERKTEINWWSCTLPSLTEAQQESEEPCPSCDQAEGGDLGDSGEWKWVSAGEVIKSHPDPPSLYLDRIVMRPRIQRIRHVTLKKKILSGDSCTLSARQIPASTITKK